MICPQCVAMVLMKILPAFPWLVFAVHWIFNKFNKIKCKKKRVIIKVKKSNIYKHGRW